MAFTHGKYTRFYLAFGSGTTISLAATVNADLSTTTYLYRVDSYCKEVSFPQKMDLAESSTFGANTKQYVQGLRDATISISGSWDGATSLTDVAAGNATTLDGLLNGMIGAAYNPSFLYAPAGTGAGKIAYRGECVMTTYNVSGSIGDLNAFSAEFQMSGDPTRLAL